MRFVIIYKHTCTKKKRTIKFSHIFCSILLTNKKYIEMKISTTVQQKRYNKLILHDSLAKQ